ncbi:hypothetical protein PRIPAC_72832 [Pristionchus pacificus]|uniref:Uncharacterized protein n=1 Tax=Pristionchus pacificus TaxID=54126 RepID=A0A2A6CFF4_PRIPA|nr:hypothetical protein PRIPAC_72832 [Pristionchus pacificus]|eukprot:PDM76846.1 hypothetical protein PRIPAC_42241 [Pristionchus pacificus]
MQILIFSIASCFILQSVYATECDGKLPTQSTCEQTINFKVYDERQANALCREFIPTTFVTGNMTTKTTVKCNATKQFDCTFWPDSIAMFDKCYKFTDHEITIKQYLANPDAYCEKDSSIPVFLTHTQSKFIAIQAAKKGMDKIWINVNRDGKTFARSTSWAAGSKIFTEPWKVHKGHYWDGDALKDGDDVNATKYFIFRSRTDYMNNLFAGSFERVTENTKAHVICEVMATVIPDQKPYCDTMKSLTIDTEYDPITYRCIYKTLSQFVIGHTEQHLKDFKGCNENPSPVYSSGVDDGTSQGNLYEKLTTNDTARIAALLHVPGYVNNADRNYEYKGREYCDPRGDVLEETFVKQTKARFKVYNHQFKAMAAKKLTMNGMKWKTNYPLNQCTDFNVKYYEEQGSYGLAIQNGQIIDVPTLVPTAVMCSIHSRAECFTNNKCREGQKCVPSGTWNEETNGFTTCECVKYHKPNQDTKTWPEERKDACSIYGIKDKKMLDMSFGLHDIPWEYMDTVVKSYINFLVVRKNCSVTMYAHEKDYGNNYPIIDNFETGEYDVPNNDDETLFGFAKQFGATSYSCSCPIENNHN